MDALNFTLRLIFVALSLTGLTACGVARVGATPSRDVALQGYSAQRLLVSSPVTVTIDNDLPGEIQVISYPAAEVAVDSITTGRGSMDDAALAYEADVALEFKDGGVSIRARPGEHAPERLLLHVRVPHGSSIVISPSPVNSPNIAIDVIIAGEIRNVTAQVHQGNITVHGATGDLTLVTGRGSIFVDQNDSQGQNHNLDLHANEGGITLFALNARVNASTTNGSIQFVGTLRKADGGDNANTLSEFNVKGAGDVSVALPESARFRYNAYGGARVITDLPREAAPCGMVPLGNYDFRRRPASDGNLGRIEVSGTVTNTNKVQGTFGEGIIFFETNRKVVTVFDPPNPPPRSGGPFASNSVGDCGRVTTDNLAKANIDLTLRAESGNIWIHQIKMK